MKLKYIGKCQPGNGPKYGHIYDVVYCGVEQSLFVEDANNATEVYVIKYNIGNAMESTTIRIEHNSLDEVNMCWESVPDIKTPSKRHCKIVRDNIPERIFRAGEFPEYIKIRDRVMIISQLDMKLSEEVKEYQESGSLEELVDIYEVICGIMYHKNISFEEFNDILLRKRETNGGFANGAYLKSVITLKDFESKFHEETRRSLVNRFS